MDVEEDDTRTRNAVSGRVDQRETENSSDSVEEQVVETVIVIEKDEKACRSEENRDLELELPSLESDQVETNLDAGVSVETRVVINPSEAQPVAGEENRVLNAKAGELGLSKVSVEESKGKSSEAERRSCVVDISCGSAKSCIDKWDGESVCRICHLSSDQSPDRRATVTSVSDLIHLGCGCKDDLGIAHYQCAEAWFKLKGNRICEICGETAKNITGVGDVRFMEEWNERFSQTVSNSPEPTRGCWRGQPFCNFLMACLVIAFVLPWFFRVNMF